MWKYLVKYKIFFIHVLINLHAHLEYCRKICLWKSHIYNWANENYFNHELTSRMWRTASRVSWSFSFSFTTSLTSPGNEASNHSRSIEFFTFFAIGNKFKAEIWNSSKCAANLFLQKRLMPRLPPLPSFVLTYQKRHWPKYGETFRSSQLSFLRLHETVSSTFQDVNFESHYNSSLYQKSAQSLQGYHINNMTC